MADLSPNAVRVLRVIEAAGADGILRSQIAARLPRLDSFARGSATGELLSAGRVVAVEDRRGRARVGTRYFIRPATDAGKDEVKRD